VENTAYEFLSPELIEMSEATSNICVQQILKDMKFISGT